MASVTEIWQSVLKTLYCHLYIDILFTVNIGDDFWQSTTFLIWWHTALVYLWQISKFVFRPHPRIILGFNWPIFNLFWYVHVLSDIKDIIEFPNSANSKDFKKEVAQLTLVSSMPRFTRNHSHLFNNIVKMILWEPHYVRNKIYSLVKFWDIYDWGCLENLMEVAMMVLCIFFDLDKCRR